MNVMILGLGAKPTRHMDHGGDGAAFRSHQDHGISGIVHRFSRQFGLTGSRKIDMVPRMIRPRRSGNIICIIIAR
jgi:hypothetical protein